MSLLLNSRSTTISDDEKRGEQHELSVMQSTTNVTVEQNLK